MHLNSANSSRSSPDKVLSREGSDQREENDYSRFGRSNSTKATTVLDSSNKPGAPKIFTSPPKHPEQWSVKNTSVNIASAFTQAILGDMSQSNPNNASWASSSSRTMTTQVPRSTSVEYVSQAEAASNRRLAAPPSRASRAKPLSRATNSESERSATYTRGKSPLEHLSTALSSATFYVRKQAEREQQQSNNEPSYDYSAEEREYQAGNASNASRVHRRNRMSVDNKAYKPPAESELESSEDDSDDKSNKRRRKKKKDGAGGLLTTLPVISQDKRRRRKKRIGTAAGAEDEQDESESDDAVSYLVL